MTYPTPGAYQEAVQFPATAFSDPMLQDADVEANVLGLPRAVTGAYAVVFPLRTRGARWAVKCFLTDVPDQKKRYRAVSEHLSESDLPYTVAFDYQPRGIQVGDGAFPLLKMEWIEGEPLNAYVTRNVHDAKALSRLLVAWREMTQALEAARIAHGDLQHGNVLVESGGQLRLVDYDTMYVPRLKGKESPEVGHRNYQHPDRDRDDYGPHVDRFSALVVDTALQACGTRPDLWGRFDTGENLLFRSDDFVDPAASPLFDALLEIDALRPQVDALRRACFVEPEDVPPLSEVLADAQSVPLKTRRLKRSSMKGHRKSQFERWFLPAGAAVVLCAALLLAAGRVLAAGMVIVAAAAAGLVPARLRYVRRPHVRRYHRLSQEHAYFQRLLRALREELEAMENRRDELISARDQTHAERLAEVQEETLHQRLKYHFVGEARDFDGINHKVIVRLKASGIRTASHATPERVAEVARLSDQSKARVNLWRAALASRYQDEIPTALSPAEERRLKRRIDRQLNASSREIERLRKKIRVQEEEHAKIRNRRDELDVEDFGTYLRRLVRIG